jgi:XTP/dITP diphosphohydrolase
MTSKLVMATANQNKIKEIKKKLGEAYQFLSLPDIGCTEDIPETQPTIEGNALQKARYVYEKYGYNCFAEDTGLEIEALGGRPGVKTARYAGEDKNDTNNINKVLGELEGQANRNARFKTVVALIIDGEEHLFEGLAPGSITTEPIGEDGFGYDPVFQPEGYEITYAQMDMQEKNKISHRAKAIAKLKEYLDQL